MHTEHTSRPVLNFRFCDRIEPLAQPELLGALSAQTQKSGPTIRFGIAGINGSNSKPFVSKQLGLFNTMST